MSRLKVRSRSQPQPPQSLRTKQIENRIDTMLQPLDVLGKRLLGDLWRIIYLTIQDAIAISILLAIPNWIGNNPSDLRTCLAQSPWHIGRYSCLVIWLSDFCLWIVLTGRTIVRCWIDFRTTFKKH
jgi:hypothetical protein